MNYALEDQNVIVTASSVAHQVNIGTMTFTLDNKKTTTKTDNAKGRIIFIKHPGWKNFTVGFNIPQTSNTNDFFSECFNQDLTVSFLWKNNGTQVINSSKGKINLVSSPAGNDVGDTVWELVGQFNLAKMGGAGDDNLELVLPQA